MADPSPPPVVLETARLILRHFCAADCTFIVELLNDPVFLRHIGDKGVRDETDARRYIEEGPVASYRRHGFGLFLVELKETGAAIGICGLVKRKELPDPDLGFAFLPRYRRNGYALESASAVLRYGREHLGLDRLVAITVPENSRSIGLLDKLGFSFERVVRLGGEGTALRLYAAGPSGVLSNLQRTQPAGMMGVASVNSAGPDAVRPLGMGVSMKLSVKAFTITFAIWWGACLLLTGLANFIWPGYAQAFLDMAASIYPGYHAAQGIGSVIVGTLYAVVDGAIAGAVFAWIYNCLVPG